jgi:hypothetical protein
MWRGEEKPPEAGQAVGVALEGTGRWFKRRGGSWGLGKWLAGGDRTQCENRERERLEVEDRDLCAVFKKCRDSTVKPN